MSQAIVTNRLDAAGGRSRHGTLEVLCSGMLMTVPDATVGRAGPPTLRRDPGSARPGPARMRSACWVVARRIVLGALRSLARPGSVGRTRAVTGRSS